MGHLILNDLRDDLVEKLNTRAATNGRTAEEELRAILEEALSSPRDDFWEEAAKWRERLKGRPFEDSTAIVREMRDRRAGLIPDDDDL